MDSILFIGAGRMGSPMAARILDAEVDLAIVDGREQALQPFRGRGVAAATRGAELPGTVVITMLPSEMEIHEALLGPDGACRGVRRELVIDMSTASPSSTVSLAAELADAGTAVVDAPVSGGVAGARAGTLTAMIGGDRANVARAVPILTLMCSDITHVGPIGAGHIVKALNNFLSAATLWSATEALVVGTRLGLDASAMLHVWSKGSGRSHATEVKLPQQVVTGRFDFGQSLELFCKDIAIAAKLAESAQAATPSLDALLTFWRDARDALGPDEDITAIARLIADAQRDSFLRDPAPGLR